VIVLPVLLAVVLCTVVWPPARLLMDRVGVPPAAAALATIMLFRAIASGLIALIVPPVLNQMPALIGLRIVPRYHALTARGRGVNMGIVGRGQL
jgi:predicted PurR-regulated permease PerM